MPGPLEAHASSITSISGWPLFRSDNYSGCRNNLQMLGDFLAFMNCHDAVEFLVRYKMEVHAYIHKHITMQTYMHAYINYIHAFVLT